jgi:hypothetical protein
MQKIIECCEYLKKTDDEKENDSLFQVSNFPMILAGLLWAFSIFYLFTPS